MVGVLPVLRARPKPAPAPVPIPASWAADFRLAVDPEQIVEHRAWQVAMACALATIDAGTGLVVVLGAAGTGKTLLLNELARRLEAAGRPYTLLDRGDLARQPVHGGIGLIDEADRIDPAVLASIVGATDRCHVLAALPRLIEQITGFANPMTVISLAPLGTWGTHEFVAGRLTRAGRPADLFSQSAMAALVEHSGGIPRVITMLAGGAVSLAAVEDATQVTAEHVEQAMTWREGMLPRATLGIGPSQSVAEPPMAPEAAEAMAPATTEPGPVRRPVRFAALAIGGAVIVALAVYTALVPPLAVSVGTVGELAAIIESPQTVEEEAIRTLVAIEPEAGPISSFEVPVGLQVDDSPVPAARPEPVLSAPTLASLSPPPADLPSPALTVVASVARTVLPASPPARVRIRYPRGDADAEARAQRQAAEMRTAGLAVEPPAAIRDGGGRPGIRYFFAEDREAAAEVARRVEGFAGDIRLIAPSRREGLPRPGTVEVLLSSR